MPISTSETRSQRAFHIFLTAAIGAGAAVFGLALLLYAYLGIFSRYYADDYCLASGFLTSGFWKSQIDLYTGWSPRFAGTFTVNLSEYLGRSAIRGWSALVIVLWVLALTWALTQAARMTRLTFSKVVALLLAEMLVFFTILEAPQQYQSIYWRIGLVTYTLPMVFMAFLTGLIFNRARKSAPERLPWWGAVACALVAFFAGGFSETYVVLQTCLLGLALVGAWFGDKTPTRRSWLLLLGAALIGSLLSLAVVIASPGNAVRLSAMPARPHFLALVRMAVTSAFLFMYMSLKDYSFQNLLALLLPMALAYGLYARQGNLPRMRPSLLTLALLLIPVASCVLILAICTPSAYAEASYPDGRVLIEARFIMVLMILAEGALIGMILSQLHKLADEPAPLALQALSMLLFLFVSLYPIYDAHKTYLEIPVFRDHAAAWDAHQAVISTSIQQGVLDINIHDSQARSFDTLSGLEEIGSDPKGWVNQCAASFFGVHHLAINQPNP